MSKDIGFYQRLAEQRQKVSLKLLDDISLLTQQRDDLRDACRRVTTMFSCQRIEGFPKCKEGDMCCICAAEAAIKKTQS